MVSLTASAGWLRGCFGNKRFIDRAEYLERANLRRIGVKSYKPITLTCKVVGYSCIVGGVVTLPLPTGSIFVIGFGCALVGISKEKAICRLKLCLNKVIGFVYACKNVKYECNLLKMRLFN